MPRMGRPSSKMAGSYRGASESLTLFGPPEIIIALGDGGCGVRKVGAYTSNNKIQMSTKLNHRRIIL